MSLLDDIKRILTAVPGVLAPGTCPVCGNALGLDEELMCIRCLMNLPRTYYHRNQPNRLTLDIPTSTPVRNGGAWFRYVKSKPYAELIRSAKYRDRPSLAYRCAQHYAQELQAEGYLSDIDVILPVPMHWTKLLKRGYNQAHEIARGMASVVGCPVGDNLIALKSHSTQTHKSGRQRLQNVRGLFGVKHPEELDGLRVAIVDDVFTTGATVRECALAIADHCTPLSIDIYTLAAASS